MIQKVCLRSFYYTKRTILSRIRLTQTKYCGVRTFLSDAYQCDEDWKNRLKDPLIMKFPTETLYYELDRRFNSKKNVSVVDVNIFVNGITDKESLEELEDVVHRFRRTPNTRHATNSLSHVVIRSFLSFDATEALMRILNDRVNYGIFHDHYTANLMMDHFLKAKNYRDAAKVATLMMLQEDFGHPISKQLALYSCHMYLLHPQPEPWDPEPIEEQKENEEDEEEVIVRVRYLTNPYFDNHFDLRDPKKLVGKTLALLTIDDVDAVSLTSQLIGWTLFENWERLSKLLQSIKDKPEMFLMKDGVDMLKKFLSDYGAQEDSNKESADQYLATISELENSGQVKDGNMIDEIDKQVKEVVGKHEEADIARQKELYKRWAEGRRKQIEKQIQEYSRRSKISEILAQKAELKKKEEELFFFENLEKHRLIIPPEEEDELINEEGKLSRESLLEIPPEIIGKTGRYSKGIIEQHEPWWRWNENKKKRPRREVRRLRGYPVYTASDSKKT